MEATYTYTEAMVEQLAAGFDALQEEYLKLHGQHQALERKLATAREQVRALRIFARHLDTSL